MKMRTDAKCVVTMRRYRALLKARQAQIEDAYLHHVDVLTGAHFHQLTYGISAELQKLLAQHDGDSRSIPTRANSVLIEHDTNGSGQGNNGGGGALN